MVNKYSVPGLVFLLLYSVFVLPAPAGGAGSTSGDFLKIGVGARAAGMGEAFSAAGGDVSSAFWNPSGLSFLRRTEFLLAHNSYLEAIQYEAVGIGFPIGPGSQALAISMQSLNFGDMDELDDTGETIGTFGGGNTAAGIFYSRALGEVFFMGIGFKSISETLDSESNGGTAADLGVTYLLGENIRAGVSAQNLGSAIKGVALPANIKLGIAYKLGGSLVCIDVDQPGGEKALVALGFEGIVRSGESSKLALRLGYKTPDSNLGGTAGIMAGFGFDTGSIGIDYAYKPFGDLGVNHLVSLTFGFGSSDASAAVPAPRKEKNPAARKTPPASGSGSIMEHMKLGNEYLAMGKYTESIAEFDAVLVISPGNRPAAQKREEARQKLTQQRAIIDSAAWQKKQLGTQDSADEAAQMRKLEDQRTMAEQVEDYFATLNFSPDMLSL